MTQDTHPKREELESLICQIIPKMRRAVDISISIRKDGDQQYVTDTWEEFLREFIRYLKLQGVENGENVLADISMHKVLSQR